MTVVDFLKHGRENAICADVLAAAMGTTPRGLRRLIMQARLCRQGNAARLCCTSPAGVVDISCRAMTRRLRNVKCRLSTTFRQHAANTVLRHLPLLPASWAYP